ncbi:hypothetical protein A2U01_0092217, partial [Trifolium medium]|nr:hypothetical protein [Trifolium medium]
SFGLIARKRRGKLWSPQTAPLIFPARIATASGVAPIKPPVEAEGGCVPVYTLTLKSV